MGSADVFGTTLTGSHPFSLVTPLKDSPDLVASLVAQHTTADVTKAVHLVRGNVECMSCHNPHVQSIDKVAQKFLVRDSSSGQMCLACHDPTRAVQGQVNLLAGWGNSIHRTATNQVSLSGNIGSYSTVALNACTSCHMSHNATAPARLLRPATPAATGVDAVTQDCMTCHNAGTFNGTTYIGNNYMSPGAPNIMAEFAKTAHPLPIGINTHDAAESGVLNMNRHSTCTDCHNPHDSAQVTTFLAPPALRLSQEGTPGVSASDGTTILTPALNQYENCLRCHGTSIGKQSLLLYGYAPLRAVTAIDPLNVINEFLPTATSSHPVMHDSSSSLSQPSLLSNMLNLDGTSSTQRVVGVRIFCTDCHNSDDNREFGGKGPMGPHGSSFSHILERNYQFGTAASPGGTVNNLYANPDLSMNGPYALCAKCHDLSKVLADTSFTQHSLHVSTYGFSCSICHTAHGMGATSSTISGERLVNFDTNVVAPNNGVLAFSHSTNTCTLVCHQVTHNADGTVSSAKKSKVKGK
jgi:nitrate/TMAO reductase-like tetraheme cytochrome c subunit